MLLGMGWEEGGRAEQPPSQAAGGDPEDRDGLAGGSEGRAGKVPWAPGLPSHTAQHRNPHQGHQQDPEDGRAGGKPEPRRKRTQRKMITLKMHRRD